MCDQVKVQKRYKTNVEKVRQSLWYTPNETKQQYKTSGNKNVFTRRTEREWFQFSSPKSVFCFRVDQSPKSLIDIKHMYALYAVTLHAFFLWTMCLYLSFFCLRASAHIQSLVLNIDCIVMWIDFIVLNRWHTHKKTIYIHIKRYIYRYHVAPLTQRKQLAWMRVYSIFSYESQSDVVRSAVRCVVLLR